MGTLSVFCDESGDFGPFDRHSPYYILALVLHDQESPIVEQELELERILEERGLERTHAIHTAPLVRRELCYREMERRERTRVFHSLVNFTRKCNVRTAAIVVDKRQHGCGDRLADRLAREMGLLIRENLAYFQSFDHVVVYYDQGQKEVTRALRLIFSANLADVEFRIVDPRSYRLFQVADLTCTLELVECKRQHEGMSPSEKAFFGGERGFAKNYLKPLRRKRLPK